MKLDPFENQLRKRPFREIPSGWRDEILNAAGSHAEAGLDKRPRSAWVVAVAWVHELLWPCPQAWAGIAAVWIAIFSVQAMGLDETAPEMATVVPASRPEIRVALEKHYHWRDEMLNVVEPEPADKPEKPLLPRPQSNRNENLITV